MTRTRRSQARTLITLLFACLVASCQKSELGPNGRMGAPGVAPVPAGVAGQVAQASAPAIPRTSDSLAYEHMVSIELSKVDIASRVLEVQNACVSSKEFGCTLLDISTEGRRGVPSGSIRMRLAPAGVDPIIAVAAKDGEIVTRNTHAEDLAQPIADTERELALMTTHRDRLFELQKRKDLNVDQLITVSKELATVQTQIDALGTQRANLRRRVDTDLLTINLSLPREESSREQHPVRDALRSFTGQFWEGVGMVIDFIAYFLPWLLVIIPGLFLLRLFWRWMSRWIARREARLPR
jgi:uncharacterized protein DUF4349